MSVEQTVGVVGLGYVGLPLALAFGKLMPCVGFDLSQTKIASYRKGIDPADEVPPEDFKEAGRLEFTTDASRLARCDVVVVAVPTPVDEGRLPDFAPLLSACATIGPSLRDGAVVVFESTVYPGATEEVCIPALEKASGKKWKRDFWVGYSPERINPGDREHSLSRVIKVVAGDSAETLHRVADLYALVVKAGVHKASSIAVAEAAKVIENTQRDLNIALMNELAIIFHRLGLDTKEVLDAAGSKWNFLRFTPGLVGGHCIGVDPYYLTYQAERRGHHPQVILAGRRINDGMGRFIAREAIKEMVAAGKNTTGANVLVLGLTFKENCSDIRNTKVMDVVHELVDFGIRVHVYDTRADREEAVKEYGIRLCSYDELPEVDAIILAVAHTELVNDMEPYFRKLRPGGCVVDVKSALSPARVRGRGYRLWRL